MEFLHRLVRRVNTIMRAPAWLRLLPLAVVVTLPLSASGQGTGTVSGTVVSTANGNYLEGAEVSIDALNLRTNTGRGGTFQLTGVPAGAHTVTVNYPGLNSFTTTVDVAAGETASVAARLASDIYTLETFKVQGSKEGMAQAVALQRISVQTKMVAAADQFGEISEGNIGEYLKFMPGVSIDYNVNDARGISLRGLSTAFTVVAVDGTPMAGASSVDDTRRFEFEQIAMNNVETTELFKTVTPDIPANATGGYVNFVTKSAFDHEDQQRVTYNVSFTAPSSNFSLGRESGVWGNGREFSIRPSVELNYSRKVSDKLGVNVNYRFSERYDDSPRTEFTWNTSTTAPTIMTNPRLQQYNIRDEQKLTHRQAFATKFDYKLSDRTSLMLAGQWNWYDLHFTQRGPQFVLGANATRSGDTYSSTAASINNNVLYRNKYGTTWHFNGTLAHDFANGAKFALTPYWSRADGQYRDGSKGFISSVATMAAGASTFTTMRIENPQNLGVLPNIVLLQGANQVPLDFIRDLGNYSLSNTGVGGNIQSRPWTAIDEKEGFRADYTQEFDRGFTLQTGVALDATERSIYRPDFRYTLTPAVTGATLRALADQGYTSDVGYGFGSYQVVDPFKIWDLVRNNPANRAVEDTRYFKEENQAGYVRGDWKWNDQWLFVGGVRWEKREITARARNRGSALAADRSVLANIALDYDEWYPSASFKYTPRRNLVVRGGVSRTVGHPDYADLLPLLTSESILGAGDGSITVPDPNLQPYFSVNYDLSADYYLKNSGVIGVYAFHKDVKNYFISRAMTATERNAIATAYGFNPAQFNTGAVRENGGKSTISGVEISYAQTLSMLPAPFNGLNLQANFTYTDIDAKDPNPLRQLDTEYSQLRAVSPKTANLVVGYRYRDWRFTVTNNWVDESLYGGFVATNYFTGSANTTNQAADTRLTLNKDEKLTTDIKVEYAFSKRFAAYFLVRNVFNTPRKEFLKGYLPQNQNVVLPLRYFEFGEPHYTLGFRGTF